MYRSAVALVALLSAAAASAQTVARPAQPITSMGQPPRWQFFGALGVAMGDDNGTGSFASAGVHRALTNPVIGLLGVSVEGGLRGRAGSTEGMVRAMATTRALGLSAGLDWIPNESDIAFSASFETAVRRGGIFGGGTMVRADWTPARDQLNLGVTVPLFRRDAGDTRQRRTAVDLPRGERGTPSASSSTAGIDAALGTLDEAAAVIHAYVDPYAATRGAAPSGAAPTPTFSRVTAEFHGALTSAFALAATPASGGAIAARARHGALHDVILPFAATFGMPKSNGGDIDGLVTTARSRFAAWLRDSSRADPASHQRALGVFARYMDVLRRVHATASAAWKDTRLVWIPPHLALTTEEYDDQEEVDGIMARAIGRPFTDRNALTLLRSSDLPTEMARSVFAARDYHVLWTHDFMGRDLSGDTDEMGFAMVADVYLPALTAAVKRYDTTGVLTQYMILLDQYYYESRAGRLWMTILENPLDARVNLPRPDSARARQLEERLAELRSAVRASPRMQRDAASNGGDGWLKKVAKVHVSIVLPADWSFRSRHLLPPFPITPDNIVRDHRKIAFYDLTEADPYRGALLMMGVGVGEHYASATWEDRGYRVRGPAALEARTAVRRFLTLNGFDADEIPPVLRAVDSPRSVEQRNDRRDYIGRALQVHNDPGFGTKQSSVARAMLYSLAPPGSVVIVPDPLWLSDTWASMLAGAAARGSRVVIIAPSLENAPAAQGPIVAVERDVIARLLEWRARHAGRLRDNGGDVRIGLYDSRAPVTDAAARLAEIRAGLERAPWIRQMFPFGAATLAALDRVVTQSEATSRDATRLTAEEKPRAPQLHQKTQLIARPGAIASLLRQPGWDAVLAQAIRVQSSQTARLSDLLGYVDSDIDSSAVRATDTMLQGYERSLSESERKRVSFYFSVGTQNQDPRGIMLDGESSIIVSGFHAAAGLVDLYHVMARTSWVESSADVDRLLPAPSGWMQRIGRLLRLVL